MKKATAKELVELFELRKTGYAKLACHSVQAVNVRVWGASQKVTADIILQDDEGNIDRYDECEYPITLLEKIGASLK